MTVFFIVITLLALVGLYVRLCENPAHVRAEGRLKLWKHCGFRAG